MDKQPTFSLLEDLICQTKEYADTKIELVKLQSVEKASYALSTLFILMVFGTFFFLFFVVLNIGLALFIGDLLGKAYWGFFIVGSFYFFVGLVLFILRNKIFKAPLIDIFIRKLL